MAAAPVRRRVAPALPTTGPARPDPGTPGGRRAMADLVAAADVVIEASRPRALARFGLDAVQADASGTTWDSITATGRASTRVGFGDDVAAGAGLVADDADGMPVFCGDAIADPLTGLTAAVSHADHPTGHPARHRDDRRRGRHPRRHEVPLRPR